ncbi:Helix-turn-helix domain-containing protein [Lentzea albidocapillata subsp. violacea]|uniref:Helix-turn-helix domain-containing protein n=1 Tax=Lentzea albidocapillata subsp. violacea TaxID=128104 RepID=A0A1G9AQS5_9PSEU|nr:helix-turn-helix transcriptional regulator [Lentzea albidocapillata]SDK29597.1 Helix-turn-helix domain-containing protein [Lentzea albidocapillata subsp. violacea]
MDQSSFASVVGRQLREARQRHGRTRKQVAAELSGRISLRSLESYEVGQRPVDLLKFVQICQVVQADPTQVLGRAIEELGVPEPSSILVDLRDVARDDAADLTPLRRWASVTASAQPYGSPVIWRFTPSAIAAMAQLCGMPPVRLRDRLRRFETRLVINGENS